MELIIYKIVSNDIDNAKIFIGACRNIKALKKRMRTKLIFRNYTKNEIKLYLYIEKNKGINNFSFIEIGRTIITKNKDKKAILQEIIKLHKPELNNKSKYIKIHCDFCNKVEYILPKEKIYSRFFCKDVKYNGEFCEERHVRLFNWAEQTNFKTYKELMFHKRKDGGYEEPIAIREKYRIEHLMQQIK